MNAIHPTAQLLGDVRMGIGNTIGPFAVITGPIVLGDENWIGAGVVIGAPPEVRSWTHPSDEAGSAGNGIDIGSRNVIREYAQIHHGWRNRTTIGDDAFIMNQSYVAHDCRLGDRVTLASSVLLAGHVVIEDDANLGLGVSVHQGRAIGRGVMLGMGSVVTRDMPPYAKAYGNPARVAGANVIGMQRTGHEASVIEALEELYSERSSEDPMIRATRIGALSALLGSWIAGRR